MSLYGAIAGQFAGKKIITGTFTPVAGTTAVEVGDKLQSVDAVLVELETQDLTHSWTKATWTGTAITFTHTKVTAANDVTAIAATTPWNVVHYVVIGDAPR